MARDHRWNDRLLYKLIEQPDCTECDVSDDGYYKNVAYHRREFFRRPGIFYYREYIHANCECEAAEKYPELPPD